MNIEQEVREMLSSKVRNAPGLEEPPQPVMRRARVRRIRNGIGGTAIAALVVFGAIAGVRVLGSDAINPTTRTGVVPWMSETAPPLVGDPELPACHAEDVRLTARSDFRALLGLEAIDAPCSLKAYSVRVLRTNGRTLPIGTLTAGAAIRVAPGSTTTLYGEWEPCAPPEPLIFEMLFIDSHNTLRAGSAAATENTCSGNATPKKLSFNGAVSPPTQRALAYLQMLDNLRATISGAPTTARPGDTLRFRVTLENTSGRQIRLEPCLTYSEQIVLGNGGPEPKRYVLNCQGVGGVFEPRESRVFAMQYTIPYDTEAGEWGLIWSLEQPPDIGSDFQPATHQITINAL